MSTKSSHFRLRASSDSTTRQWRVLLILSSSPIAFLVFTLSDLRWSCSGSGTKAVNVKASIDSIWRIVVTWVINVQEFKENIGGLTNSSKWKTVMWMVMMSIHQQQINRKTRTSVYCNWNAMMIKLSWTTRVNRLKHVLSQTINLYLTSRISKMHQMMSRKTTLTCIETYSNIARSSATRFSHLHCRIWMFHWLWTPGSTILETI